MADTKTIYVVRGGAVADAHLAPADATVAKGGTSVSWDGGEFEREDGVTYVDQPGALIGWVMQDGSLVAPPEPPPPPPPVPGRCSKLGLKRALAETGPDAVFQQPEWPAVKAAIEADSELQEDWDLATAVVRTDPLVRAMIAARKYDDATVDKILLRANALAG